MFTKRIGIITRGGDLHGRAVKKYVEDNLNARCHLFECDRLAGNAALTWQVDDPRAMLPDDEGEVVDVADLDTTWYRRAPTRQRLGAEIEESEECAAVINADCGAAMLGMFATSFCGTWISEPHFTEAAENKLVQLKAATAAGFRVPRTLISQHPPSIRRFADSLEGRVIVKQIKSTRSFGGATTIISNELLQSQDVLELAPTMYQELIPGEQHLRVHCFGTDIHTTLIESKDLDWRFDLNVPMREIRLDACMNARLLRVLDILKLRMGIFDFKIDREGEIVWLEVNPQGQFLFIEGLTGAPLTAAMATFLTTHGREPSIATAPLTALAAD